MEALKQVEHLVSTRIALVKTLLTMMRLEARLAGLSVFPLVLNICLLLVVFMACWLLFSLLMGYGILFVSNSFPLSLCFVFLFNLCALLGLAKYLTFNLKNMSFEKTRAYFSQNKSIEDEQFEKAVDKTNSGSEHDVTSSADANRSG